MGFPTRNSKIIMARSKKFSRGEKVFTDPRAAAQYIRDLQDSAGGERIMGTRHAMSQLGMHPAHTDKRMSDQEAASLADQTDAVAGEVPITYQPTASSKPEDPRTAAMGYDPSTQRMLVQWGDGGTPYYYYDVTPQEWSAMQKTSSPGKMINRLFNHHNYGPVTSED